MDSKTSSRKNFESMLFDFGTTVRTDYRDGKILSPITIKPKEKPVCFRVRPPPLKGIHTLTQWKGEPLPFSFFIKPKEILRTNPRDIQQAYTKTVDNEKDEARRTRPRLVMTPAVSMDDIENAEIRKILVEEMYTSSMTRSTREAVSEYFTVRAPFPGKSSPSNPVFLPKLQSPFVEPCWRMESVKWDQKQLRSHCNPTADFWKRTGSSVNGTNVKKL